TMLASGPYAGTSSVPLFSFAGDGSQTNVFSYGNYQQGGVTPSIVAAEDTTNPGGQISQLFGLNLYGNYLLPNITNKVVGSEPSSAFVLNQLALIRTIDTSQSIAEPAGVTDVKLLRVSVSGGGMNGATGLAGIKIIGDGAAAAPVDTSAP